MEFLQSTSDRMTKPVKTRRAESTDRYFHTDNSVDAATKPLTQLVKCSQLIKKKTSEQSVCNAPFSGGSHLDEKAGGQQYLCFQMGLLGGMLRLLLLLQLGQLLPLHLHQLLLVCLELLLCDPPCDCGRERSHSYTQHPPGCS